MRLSRACSVVLLGVSAVFFPSISDASCGDGPPPEVRKMLRDMGFDKDIQSMNPDFSFIGGGVVKRGFQGLRATDAILDGACDCQNSQTINALMTCVGTHVTPQLMCDLYGAAGRPDFRNPFAVLGARNSKVGQPLSLAWNAYHEPGDMCDPPGGQGTTLYCCHNDGNIDGACNAMYNPGNIACVGHPPSGGAVGIAINGLCEHVAECTLTDLSPQVNDPVFAARRISAWAQRLMIAYSRQVAGHSVSPCNSDFVTMHGCKGFFDLVVAESEPFFSAEADPENAMTEAASIAAQRVMFAIPNGMQRYSHVSGLKWSDSEKSAYLAGIDARTELLKWMSPCALSLLQETMPDTWQLMAVPHPTEGAPDKTDADGDWQDGCLMGQPPEEPSIKAQRRGSTISLIVKIDDPEAETQGVDALPLTIHWGDGVVTGNAYAHNASNVYSRTFTTRVIPKTFRIGYMNASGYSVSKTVAVPEALKIKQ